MLLCADCKSHNIVETEDFLVYFLEGNILRLRGVNVYQNLNCEPKGYIASCPELSLVATAIGNTELDAILALGDILKKIIHVKMLGKRLEEEL